MNPYHQPSWNVSKISRNDSSPPRLPRNLVETTRMSATLVASADLSNPGCRWFAGQNHDLAGRNPVVLNEFTLALSYVHVHIHIHLDLRPDLCRTWMDIDIYIYIYLFIYTIIEKACFPIDTWSKSSSRARPGPWCDHRQLRLLKGRGHRGHGIGGSRGSRICSGKHVVTNPWTVGKISQWNGMKWLWNGYEWKSSIARLGYIIYIYQRL